MAAKPVAMWIAILGAVVLLYAEYGLQAVGLSILDVGQAGYGGFLLIVALGVGLVAFGVVKTLL